MACFLTNIYLLSIDIDRSIVICNNKESEYKIKI